MTEDSTESADDLQLRFPSRPGYLGISRLNATAIAASAGFDVEQLDDVRLAVGEAVAWLLSGDVDGAVEVTLTSRPGAIDFRAVLTGADIPDSEPDDLVHAILGAVTEKYAAGRDDQGHRHVSLSMRSGNG